MLARIVPVGGASRHDTGWMPELSVLELDTQVARLRELNRAETELARAIRDMVNPSNIHSPEHLRGRTSCAMAEPLRIFAATAEPKTHDIATCTPAREEDL